MTPPILALLVGVLLAGNYFLATVLRGIFRWQMINRYHYDYYDAQPMSTTGQLLHCTQMELFRWPTLLLTVALCSIEVSAFYWLLLS